jgi:hypothetical protein
MANSQANRTPFPNQLVGANSPDAGPPRRSSFIRLRPQTATPRPDLAGSRRVVPETAAVFLVDPEGYRRRVPNSMTYNRLFRSWHDVVDDANMEEIAERPEFTTGAMLVRGEVSPAIFLLDHAVKRWIVSDAALEKYWFNVDRVFVVGQSLIDRIPNGPPWR